MLTLEEAVRARHSVRCYREEPLDPEKCELLQKEAVRINGESGLNLCLFFNETEAFDGDKPHYGSFRNVRNYAVIYGRKGQEEQAGYWGEEFVLFAQRLGLHSCWVALTYRKNAVPCPDGQCLLIVIALGVGENEGIPHKSKPLDKLARLSPDDPEWYLRGVEWASLAPTAINQQRFFIRRDGSRVSIERRWGPCSAIDLGIVKHDFEAGAGKENFDWA